MIICISGFIIDSQYENIYIKKYIKLKNKIFYRFPQDSKNASLSHPVKNQDNYGDDFFCYSTPDHYISSYQSHLPENISLGQNNFIVQNNSSYSPYQVSNYDGQYFISDPSCTTDVNQAHKMGGCNVRNGDITKRCRSQST